MNGSQGCSRTWAMRTVAALAATAAISAGRAAEPLSITRLYGAGVHAYFTGDYQRSYDDLTGTIEAGSRDPRTRYFRGLAALGLGRFDEAEADFSQGALLEAEAGGDWPVSRSLERVQGQQRFQLERHRVRARVAALQLARERDLLRFQQNQAAQPDVQRGRRPTGQPSGPDEPTNPFADDGVGRPVVPERTPPPEEMPAPSEPAPEFPGGAEEPAPGIPATEEQPAAGGTDLQPEMEQPAGEAGDGAAEQPADGAPVELPGDDAGVPAEEPAAETPATEEPAAEPAAPAEPAAGEDPFDDKASEPDAAGEPMAEDGAAPAAGGE